MVNSRGLWKGFVEFEVSDYFLRQGLYPAKEINGNSIVLLLNLVL